MDLASLLPLMAGIIAIATFLYKCVRSYTDLEWKVRTMWAFRVRQSENDGYNQGWFLPEGPMLLSPQVYEIYEPLARELQAWYPRYHHRSLQEQMIFLERDFGYRLDPICREHHITSGLCLRAAIEVARGM